MKIKKISSVIIITILIDFLFSQLFILDFLDHKRNEMFKGDTENRIYNKDYLYTFRKNTVFKSRFYDFKTDIFTNDLGFRSKRVGNIDRSKKFSLVVGDSFVEGVRVIFDNTIVGQLNQKTIKEFPSYEFLNAGSSSYTTYIYLKKIKTIINENKNLNFRDVLVFFDKSDIRGDADYLDEPNSFPEWKLIDDQERTILFKKDLKELNIWSFFTKQTVTGRLFRLLGDQIENFLRNIRDRYVLSKKLNINFFKISDAHIYALKSIDEMEYYKEIFYGEKWKENGIKLAKFSIKNLVKIKKYLDKNNINLYVVLFPWPYELVESEPKHNYLQYVKKELENNNIKYFSTYPLFDTDKPYSAIKEYYFYDDIHFNEKGYKIIADYLFDELKKVNTF